MKRGLFPMVADVIHTGHILAIEEAKNNCDFLILGLHCCPNYKQPVQSIYERYIQLMSIKHVDQVIPYYDKEDCKHMIMSLNFDIYFLGEDHSDKVWENSNIVKSLGKEVYYLPRKHVFSSTDLKIRIVNSEINTIEKDKDNDGSV